jgi:ABC-type nitrate/sulfonate/bicarbonate transport system substrate-binding protein
MAAQRWSCLILLLQALGAASTGSAQPENIRLLYYPPWNISKLPLYVAREMGIFEKHGLEISWTNPGSNNKLLAAMKNGAVDIAIVSSNHVVQNNASGGPPMIVVGNTGYNYSVFLVDAAIKRPEDLKGKKIGSGEAGSTPDQLTRLALRKLGLDPDRDVALTHFEDARSTDRAKALTSGQITGSMVTAEAIYELEKSGRIKDFRILADHKRLNIYAGGGADYAVATAFLKNRRPEAKSFMAAICEGIAVARQNKSKALEIMTNAERNREAALMEYLYRLYITEVIPARPHPKLAGVELGIEMQAPTLPAARGLKASELVDASLVHELEKEGRCNF